MDITTTLEELGVRLADHAGHDLWVRSPIDGAQLASLRCTTTTEACACVAQAVKAFKVWREVPAPKRGELVRLFAEALQ